MNSPEWSEYRDRVSGLTVRQLTNYKGHSYHPYFTNSGWYDGGRRLLFASDRANETNFFSIDLASGEITQVTNFHRPPGEDLENALQDVCVNPNRAEAYFWLKRDLVALDIHSGAYRVLYHTGEGIRHFSSSCTADGQFVCTSLTEDLSHRIEMDLTRGYIGFEEYFAAKPLCQILRVAVDGSRSDIVHEENCWIGHVNPSPTQPHLLSFCHEGPWHLVDQRIWGFDLNTGRAWKIRPGKKGESLGHEYWLADGESLGYHGHLDGRNFFGFVRYDNTGLEEAPLEAWSNHFFSNDRDLIVSDTPGGMEHIALYRRKDGVIESPRTLCEHRSSSRIQITHVHAKLTPDSRQVLFTSDRGGYGNLYLVDIPANIESLPVLEVKA